MKTKLYSNKSSFSCFIVSFVTKVKNSNFFFCFLVNFLQKLFSEWTFLLWFSNMPKFFFSFTSFYHTMQKKNATNLKRSFMYFSMRVVGRFCAACSYRLSFLLRFWWLLHKEFPPRVYVRAYSVSDNVSTVVSCTVLMSTPCSGQFFLMTSFASFPEPF